MAHLKSCTCEDCMAASQRRARGAVARSGPEALRCRCGGEVLLAVTEREGMPWVQGRCIKCTAATPAVPVAVPGDL